MQHTSIVYFSLYLSSVVSDHLAPDLARAGILVRAGILARPVTANPVKHPKDNPRKSVQRKLCVPVRKQPLHSPPKTKITAATLNFGWKTT